MKTTRRKHTTRTLARLIESTDIPPALVRAVVRQVGGWKSFVKSAPDIAKHGIDGGFQGFIYYTDTELFASRNRNEIAQMASNQASEFGVGVFDRIRSFGCFRHATPPSDEAIGSALYAGKDVPGEVNMLNFLAWYAGEEVARAYCDAFDPQ